MAIEREAAGPGHEIYHGLCIVTPLSMASTKERSVLVVV